MFKNFRLSLKKSKILNKITKCVEGKITDNKESCIQELFTLLSKDRITVGILEDNNMSFEDLRKIISNLELNGAGQIVKGHYVPVSSIAFTNTLMFLCNYWNEDGFDVKNMDRYNSNQKIAYDMLNSF